MHLAVAEALAIFFFLIAYAANGTKVQTRFFTLTFIIQ